MPTALEQLRLRLADVHALHNAITVLDWDQQTYMPEGGSESRAEHTSCLSRMAHELFVDDKTKSLIDAASPETDIDQAELRVIKRRFDLATKFPASLVAEKSRLSSIAHNEWVAARASNNFKSFVPTLSRMFEIAREEAELLGYTDHIYDALLDQYEEGSTAADCRRMFDALKAEQAPLILAIKELPEVDDSWLYGEWDIPTQRKFTETIVKEIGFDFERGRQDEAPHPFCTTFGVGDVRLTTRYKPYLGSAIFGSLHEAGHGMYEQGSPASFDRTFLQGGVSLGLHESQSRTWENLVGRSREFWSIFLPKLQQAFPVLANKDLDTFYRGINKVEPSLIRVEADEMTYNMHVLIRFEIECDVLTGALEVKDMPEAWNAKYQQYLGITPPNDAQGCLQDVHWSMGSIGYFPTYSMGNVLSYQIWNAMEKEIGNVHELMAKGDFATIHGWLRENMYQHGCRYAPKELVLKLTGKPLDPTDYLTGITAKYRAIYGL
ncbi:MAG: carboxypeptidase M32 [Armatimonadetes bacterium]|nr:carboxypeptidase M32 [Armatimonadota bacterium]